MGSADQFQSEGLIATSEKALLAFLDTIDQTKQAVMLTNSCLSFRNNQGQILQLGKPVLAQNTSNMFGMMIYDSDKETLPVMLGGQTGIGFLSLGHKGGATVYSQR